MTDGPAAKMADDMLLGGHHDDAAGRLLGRHADQIGRRILGISVTGEPEDREVRPDRCRVVRRHDSLG